METIDVPCKRCDEFRQRFQNAGYQVLDCKPASAAGMCTLRYQAPEAAVAPATPVAAASRSAGGEPAPVAPAAPTLTPIQAATAKAIVNIFETSRVLGDYGRVTVLAQDRGRLTYGRSQTSLASGNLFKLLERYCNNPGARFAARLRPLLPRFAEQAASLDDDERVQNLLRACADDHVMRETQDQFFDDEYWSPSVGAASRLGITSPLGIAVVYDSRVHGSWDTLRKRTDAAAGKVAEIGERAWIAAYVDTRREWLQSSSNATLRTTVYRMDSFRDLIHRGFWGLPLPLIVRGQEISLSALSANPEGCYDGPQPGTRTLALEAPAVRGLDVRLVQLGLSDRGMNITADGIFGRVSKQRIADYQIAHGNPATGIADRALIGELLPHNWKPEPSV